MGIATNQEVPPTHDEQIEDTTPTPEDQAIATTNTSDERAIRRRIGHRQFISAWADSKSIDDVLTKLDLNDERANRLFIYQRAAYLRNKGITLKKFTRRSTTNWDELAEYSRRVFKR